MELYQDKKDGHTDMMARMTIKMFYLQQLLEKL